MIREVSSVLLISPLIGAFISGLICPVFNNKRLAHYVTIFLVSVSLLSAFYLFDIFILNTHAPEYISFFNWLDFYKIQVSIGIYLDELSVMMIMIVVMISFFVHIYSIGYMEGEAGYCRFFSYLSFFTFAMLMLVSAENLVQLFFGWEGVGVASYLLIGYYFTKDSATSGAIKAFVVNRVGDLGLLIAIALCYHYTQSFSIPIIIDQLIPLTGEVFAFTNHFTVNAITLITFMFLIASMGKSAQIPLHVWLPESMEGPTPISALIHAATMVTAGIYLICRFSTIFDLSPTVLNLILFIGSTGALFLGLVGIVQNDIKRIVAYSTLSQLGYMIAATGASAYSAAMFHLFMHAFFKALLFLAAGAVIIAMHHEQNIQKMGGLRKDLPLVYYCSLIGTLALVAFPFFSGFYSKDSIIDAVYHSKLAFSSYAYICLLLGAAVTAMYSFRSLFLVFHGEKRFEDKLHHVGWQINLPLVFLAIPSAILGFLTVRPIFVGNILGATLSSSTMATSQLNHLAEEFSSPTISALHAVFGLPFYFTLLGFFIVYVCYVSHHSLYKKYKRYLKTIAYPLDMHWGFDWLVDQIVRAYSFISKKSYDILDRKVIDEGMISSIANGVWKIGGLSRGLQTGYLFHYASMIIFALLTIILILYY